MTRDIMIPGYQLELGQAYETYIALVENVASYSETFIEQDASPQMKQFVPIQYELTAKFYPELV